jgi:2-dehydropantoate 2-reductase
MSRCRSETRRPSARIAYGELDGGTSERLRAFHEVALAAGLDATLSEDIQPVIWGKFAMLAPMAGVTTLTRRAAGPVREDADMHRLFEDAVGEVVAVAAAKGIDMAGTQAETMRLLEEFPYEGKSSMLMDLEKGGRLELEGLSGAVVRLGRELGVETPTHQVIYAALKPWAEGPLPAERGGPSPEGSAP